MRIRLFLVPMALSLVATSCSHKQQRTITQEFSNEIVIKTTPVKNQGQSSLCWAYAMLATIESERLMLGDSVNLSPDYLARLWLQDQAKACYLTKGKRGVSLSGMAKMTLSLMEQYGIEPYDSYHPYENVNYTALCRIAQQVAHAAASIRQLDERLTDILDSRIGFLPPNLFMLGATYTPKQFAESICLPGDYIALTSFTHHPFGENFIIESPDNILSDYYQNIPIDSMMDIIVGNLRCGHAVCWEGDITEPGFDFANGIATLANDDKPVTQEKRQHDAEHFLTTDDHCMELCGLAHDATGKMFFIAKNSWGENNRYKGFMYLSYNYVKSKTVAVIVHRKE